VELADEVGGRLTSGAGGSGSRIRCDGAVAARLEVRRLDVLVKEHTPANQKDEEYMNQRRDRDETRGEDRTQKLVETGLFCSAWGTG
jgi:hypothetical protein